MEELTWQFKQIDFPILIQNTKGMPEMYYYFRVSFGKEENMLQIHSCIPVFKI